MQETPPHIKLPTYLKLLPGIRKAFLNLTETLNTMKEKTLINSTV